LGEPPQSSDSHRGEQGLRLRAVGAEPGRLTGSLGVSMRRWGTGVGGSSPWYVIGMPTLSHRDLRSPQTSYPWSTCASWLEGSGGKALRSGGGTGVLMSFFPGLAHTGCVCKRDSVFPMEGLGRPVEGGWKRWPQARVGSQLRAAVLPGISSEVLGGDFHPGVLGKERRGRGEHGDGRCLPRSRHS
jgi:hypothetical protein